MNWQAEKVEVEQGSAEWHKMRALSVGGSDAAVLWGVSPYKNERQLIEEKLAALSGNYGIPTKQMQAGTDAEPRIRDWWEKETLWEWPPAVIKGDGYHASLDGFHDARCIEIKLKGPRSFEQCREEIPLHDRMQVWHNLLVSECMYCTYIVENAETGEKLTHVVESSDIPDAWAARHLELIQQFNAKLRAAIDSPFQIAAAECYLPGKQIVSPEQASDAASHLRELKENLKKIQEARDEIIRPMREAQRKADELFRPAIERLKEDIEEAKNAIAEFRKSSSIQIESKGSLVSVGSKPDGVKTRQIKSVSITDMQALVKWASEGDNAKLLDIALTKEAKDAVLKQGIKIPGVEIIVTETIVAG